ncbi:allantoinase AllB [Streptomyces sp. NPDC006463]|uniref:allantoinase AllB n=1 Tax=Streptomyces sp. NPDC006463 TaxID=3364746 RepID=UPI00367EC6FB
MATEIGARVFRSRRAVLPEGERPADVVVVDGRITEVAEYASITGHPVEDLGDLALLPGAVDTHVHINEPGRTEWEGFHTATRAAAAGGVTTLIDMPLNSIPPTTTVEHLEVKRQAALGSVFVDVGFWGGAIPGNTGDLEPLHNAGVFGFKSYLSPSGVDEFPHLGTREQLREALAEQARIGARAIIHAEDPQILDAAPSVPGRDYDDYLASRPGASEVAAVEQLLEMAKETGAKVHVLHVSCADVMPVIAKAKAEGVDVTAETCPHYLTLAAEEIPAGNTAFKCCPPIREESNRDRLWEALANGEFVGIVTDHSPSTLGLKLLDTGDFASAWGGIASLQLGLSAIWTEAARRGHSLSDVVRWMSTGTAAFAGLDRKGAIAVGKDADLVAFAPEATQHIEAGRLLHKNPVTPYSGRTLTGVVQATWLRGEKVDVDGAPKGRLLKAAPSSTTDRGRNPTPPRSATKYLTCGWGMEISQWSPAPPCH